MWPGFVMVLEAAPPSARGKFYFGFRAASIEDVDQWAVRLREAGGVVSGPADRGGNHSLFCSDPDGYRIEIFHER